MGDYFNEEEKKIVEEREHVGYPSLREIIGERQKLAHEVSIKIPMREESITLIDFDLFGDPDKVDFVGTIDKYEARIKSPYIKGHPIATEAERIINQMKMMKIEYRFLHGDYKSYLQKVFSLLDSCIRLARKVEQGKAMPESTEDKVITQEMVDEFMTKKGAQIISLHKKAVEELDDRHAFFKKEEFFNVCNTHFRGVNSEHTAICEAIFEKYSAKPVKVYSFSPKNSLASSSGYKTKKVGVNIQKGILGIEDSEEIKAKSKEFLEEEDATQ